MSKTEKRLIPELRFPEFEKDGEWEKEVLGHILIFQTGYPFDSKGFNENMNGVRLIKNRDLKSDDKLVFYSKSFDEKYLVNDGDVLVGMDGDFTPHIWKRGKALLNQRVGRIIATKKGQEVFFYYFLNIHLKRIEERTARTTVKHLSHSVVEKIYEALPKPKEQQKIASCLSSLDDVIAVHTDKLENLKQYKKGLLQNVFPQEGETVPKLRFKEFENDGEWDSDKLDNLAKTINEKVGNRKFTLISIDAGVGLVSQIEKFGREIAGNSYSNYIVIKRDDFAFNKSSTKYFPEGQISILNNYEVGAVPNSIFTCFRFNTDIINPHYVKYLFENNIHGKWLKKFITIGARANGALNVNNKDLFSLEIPFPNNKNEQKKIASLLISLDDLIQAEADKITQLKAHKKGLLQGLFPKIE